MRRRPATEPVGAGTSFDWILEYSLEVGLEIGLQGLDGVAIVGLEEFGSLGLWQLELVDLFTRSTHDRVSRELRARGHASSGRRHEPAA